MRDVERTDRNGFRQLYQARDSGENAEVFARPDPFGSVSWSFNLVWEIRLSSLDFDLKERVRQSVDILDVVSATLEVQPQGRNFVARCPWHDDRRPSMTINQERQSWKCWPCDIGGDVFSFVMRRDGVDFPGALRLLAEMAGIPIEQYSQGRKTEFGHPDDRETLLAAMKSIADHYYDLLEAPGTPDAKLACDYLRSRGIDEENRKRFRIGFAPDSWDYAVKYLKGQKFSGEVAHAAGAASAKRSGQGFVDMFRGRLMFPICDLQNRPIALGGRVIPAIAERHDEPGGKYINGRETMLFRKSRQLYGLQLARDSIRREGQVLVMEGYTDVVAARQAGIETAVAVLGTALTRDHIKLLRRFVQRVVLVLDGDAAGQRRADEVLELFIGEEIDLRVLTLPEGMDPADYIGREGREAFEGLVAEAPDAMDHKLSRLTDGVDFTRDTHAVMTAVDTMLKIVAKAPEGLRVDQLVVRLSKSFNLRAERLEQRLQTFKDDERNRRRAARTKPSVSRDQASAEAKGAPRSIDSPAKPPQGVASEFPQDQDVPYGVIDDGFSPFDVESAFSPPVKASDAPYRTPQALPQITGLDVHLFETLVEEPDLAAGAVEAVDPDWLSTVTAKMLLSAYQDLDLKGMPLDSETLLSMVENEQLKNAVVTIQSRVDERRQARTDTPQQRYVDILERYRDLIEKTREIEQVGQALLAEKDEDELLKKLFEEEMQRQQNKAKT